MESKQFSATVLVRGSMFSSMRETDNSVFFCFVGFFLLYRSIRQKRTPKNAIKNGHFSLQKHINGHLPLNTRARED